MPVSAATIYASGQLLVVGDPSIPAGQPGHNDSRENYVYAIDTRTGMATPISPATTGLPGALAGTRDQRLLGFVGGKLGEIDLTTAAQEPIGRNNGLSSTSFEILPDNRGFLLPFDENFHTQQLFGLDIATGTAAPISPSTMEIGNTIDIAAGNPLGTAEPFLIGLGAVGDMLYGVDLDTESLIRINPNTGTASVVGAIGAVGSISNGPFPYSGFAAVTGVDEDGNGDFDALFGSVNFIEADGEATRLGGIARFDLTDGTWQLVGTNPGVIFLGFGSSPAVPEPSSMLLLVGAATAMLSSRRSFAVTQRRDPTP